MITKRAVERFAKLGYDGLKQARRIVVFIIGISIVLIGVVMIVLPGPAFIIIPLGLTILATEFLWARRLLKALRARLSAMKDQVLKPKA